MSEPAAEDLAFTRAVLDGLADWWVRSGRPLPRTVPKARSVLNAAIRCALSDTGQTGGSDDSNSSQDTVIGTAELAEHLGCTRRTAQRRAEAAGAQRISGTGAYVVTEKDIAVIGVSDGHQP